MKKICISGFLLVLIVFLVSCGVSANVFNWKYYETDNFVVFYQEKYDWKAKEASSYSGSAEPRECKITIYTDRPSTMLALGNYQNHFQEISVHEFTHLTHLTNTSGLSSKITSVLGNTFAPNNHSPTWIIEGITTNESETAAYEGRLNQGYYDAVVASKASSGEFPSILGAGYNHGHFPGRGLS
ncbi:hypothetical protein [Halanaerobacter jeridensis]|uniref:Uncharacterized protein n=1 Tax=Halanaerobacter jeridensis TaxID=706427 RepID=A0A938XVS4_9FIRM|nr:hypothetical protein [Halanaerobacter jeridensis]MBM7556155.1 hypothetical protein [Halanaerobacter jeridensis]